MNEGAYYDYNVKPVKRKRAKGWMIWLGIVVAVALIGLLVSQVGCNADKGGFSRVKGPYVGVLYVDGVIADNNVSSWGIPSGYQHGWTLDTIDSMMEDDRNKGIVLFVNSPGGGIYESDELYLKLVEYKESTGRPLYAYMGSMAASGGYYISAPADKILANRNCWTGSIGVTIGTFFDVSEFLERYGVKTVTITSGANKAMGSYVDPMTSVQRDIFQGLVDEAYEQFVAIVAKERDLGLERVKGLADGRIYTARQATENGLIDGVCVYSDALKDMRQAYDLHNCDFIDFYYRDDSLIGRLLAEAEIPKIGTGDAGALLSFMEMENRFPIGYICHVLYQ
ncbi:MAG: signal peptide peptidase SppA [Anaerovoracaceae bacterium]|jgi:protease-4